MRFFSRRRREQDSPIVKLLFEMRERPQDFVLGQHTLTHTPSGQEFWVGNGLGHYGLWRPAEVTFCAADRLLFHRAFIRWRDDWLRAVICEPPAPAPKKVRA